MIEDRIDAIVALLSELEDRMLAAPPVDNLKTVWLKLEIHPDGSGSVVAGQRKHRLDESDKIKMLNTVLAKEDSIIDFDSIPSLHGALVAATCKSGRGDA